MSRPRTNTTDGPGQDSFLDIVANIVGILIILVMLVAVRVKNAPVVAALRPNDVSSRPELLADLAAEESLRTDVLSLARHVKEIEGETATASRSRDALATMVAAIEQKIRQHRDKLDTQSQQDFDQRSALSAMRHQVEQIENQRIQIANLPKDAVTLESLPTPLSRSVNGREIHFQLREGHIAWVPMRELVEALKDDAQRQISKLRSQSQLVDRVGPIEGWYVRYELDRYDLTEDEAYQMGYRGSVVRLDHCTFVPPPGLIGEPIDLALAEGSQFRRVLARHLPSRSTVTIWTYDDSFEAYRQIKRVLFTMGYATAARPLPDGTPISGSPDGTKSAAQ